MALSKVELDTSLTGLKKPMPSSYEAVMPFTADKEVYLLYSGTDLW